MSTPFEGPGSGRMSQPDDDAAAAARADGAEPAHGHHPHLPDAIRHPHLPEGKSTPPVELIAVPGAGSISSTTVGVIMIIGGIVVLVDTLGLKEATDPLGPRAMPTLVGSLLIVLGALLVLRYIRPALRYWRAGAPREHAPRLLRVAALVALLVAFALLLPLLGFVVASALLFTGAALLLDGPPKWQLILYGWILAAAIFLIFDRLIGLSLPVGPWGF
jgi:putative tricarboxylic transport membrane protein